MLYSPYLRRYCPTCGGITCIEPKRKAPAPKLPMLSFSILLGGSAILLIALVLVKHFVIK